MEKIEKETASDPSKAGKIEWFLQGTLYVAAYGRCCGKRD